MFSVEVVVPHPFVLRIINSESVLTYVWTTISCPSQNYYEPDTPVTPRTTLMEAPKRRRRKRQGGRGEAESHDGGREEKERTSTNTVLTKDLPGFTGSEVRR